MRRHEPACSARVVSVTSPHEAIMADEHEAAKQTNAEFKRKANKEAFEGSTVEKPREKLRRSARDLERQ
jgi:hypothetical protein